MVPFTGGKGWMFMDFPHKPIKTKLFDIFYYIFLLYNYLLTSKPWDCVTASQLMNKKQNPSEVMVICATLSILSQAYGTLAKHLFARDPKRRKITLIAAGRWGHPNVTTYDVRWETSEDCEDNFDDDGVQGGDGKELMNWCFWTWNK